MLKNFVRQLNLQKVQNSNSAVTSPFESQICADKKNLLKRLSQQALNLYQKKTDIKNFTKLALSNPEDTSHNDLIKEKELDEYDILFDLSKSEEFLKDLGL